MTVLAINDLAMGKELDRAAMAQLTGRGTWHMISKTITTGSWSGYTDYSKVYKGTKFHDGYLSRHYVVKSLRTRKQYEWTSWNKYVKV